MRTTIDLRPDLHRRALAIARDSRRSLSDTVNDLLSSALDPKDQAQIGVSRTTGLRTVRLGRPVTSDDVRELDDE